MRQSLQLRRLLASSAALVALSVALPSVGKAVQIVHSGFDVFLTAPGTAFDFNTVPNPQIVNFEGNPLGCFDFGDGNGCANTGTTDTIVERLDTTIDIDGGGSDTIDIEIVALSLVSIGLVDLGFGAGFEDLLITLNTSSPSIQSTMTIFDDLVPVIGQDGTFDSVLNFSFDVAGSIGGFYGTLEQTFNSFGTNWVHDHSASDGPLIDDVNHDLNGVDHSQDFWLGWTGAVGASPRTVLHTGPHPVIPNPEPGTGLLLGIGLIGMGISGRRRRRA